MEYFSGQFFLCCFVVSPNPLIKCYTVARSRPLRDRSSTVPCCLIFVIFYLRVFVIREIAVGDRWSLFQKCKVAECLVFIEFDFRYCDIFFKWKGYFCQVSLYTIHLFFYVRMSSKNLSRNFKRYVLEKLTYIQWPPKLSGHLTKKFCSLYFSKMKEAIGLRVLSCRSPMSLVCF